MSTVAVSPMLVSESDESGEKRQYHETKAAYALPNDNVEQQRLELQHSLFKGLMGERIIHAPLPKDIGRAVDIGCGTGSVTHEIASNYASASVYGVDLSAVPTNLRTPLSNLTYVQADFDVLTNPENPDPRFPQASFDYVFSRMLIYGITNWKSYVERAVLMAEPGAWVEMQEADYHWYRLPSSSGLPSRETFAPHTLSLSELEAKKHPSEAYAVTPFWSQTHNSLLRAKSLNPFAGSELGSLFDAAGLEDIAVRRYISTCGEWEGLTPEAAQFGQYVGKADAADVRPAYAEVGARDWARRAGSEDGNGRSSEGI